MAKLIPKSKQVNLIVNAKRFTQKRKTLNNATIGLLMSYLKRSTPSDYSDFIKDIDMTVETILA